MSKSRQATPPAAFGKAVQEVRPSKQAPARRRSRPPRHVSHPVSKNFLRRFLHELTGARVGDDAVEAEYRNLVEALERHARATKENYDADVELQRLHGILRGKPLLRARHVPSPTSAQLLSREGRVPSRAEASKAQEVTSRDGAPEASAELR